MHVGHILCDCYQQESLIFSYHFIVAADISKYADHYFEITIVIRHTARTC